MKMFLNEDAVASIESLVVDAKGAAKMLSVCERTIRNLTKSGELPVIRIAGCVRYSVEALKEFIRQKSTREVKDKNVPIGFIPGTMYPACSTDYTRWDGSSDTK